MKHELMLTILNQQTEIAGLKSENERVKDENARLRAELSRIRSARDSQQPGSIAEEAIRVSGVLTAAQSAADEYLAGVKNRQQAAEREAASILENAQSRCAEAERESQARIDAAWDALQAKLEDYCRAHSALHDLLGSSQAITDQLRGDCASAQLTAAVPSEPTPPYAPNEQTAPFSEIVPEPPIACDPELPLPPRTVDEKPKKPAVKRKKSAFRIVWNVFTTVLVAAVVLLATALVGVRLFGFTPYAVLSPSMTPTYCIGDLIYVKTVDPSTVSEGDVITFRTAGESNVVTHRVDGIDRTAQLFYTKGDANENRDGNPVPYESVVGVVKFALPKLGYVSAYLSGATGRYAVIAGALLLVLLYILPQIFMKEEKKKPRQCI